MSPARSYRWLLIEADELLANEGAGPLLAICRRADRHGYNGLLLWDSSLWARQLRGRYGDTEEALQEGLGDLGWALPVPWGARRETGRA